jgi:phage N-6-adenine-methyltransferase
MTERRGGTLISLKKTGTPKLNSGMFTSASDEWETPQKFFDALDTVFHFTLDVCASSDNAKCRRYYTKANDGLTKEWSGICWMNPPYGREISLWVKKAYESSMADGTVVVCLLPARTDTRWWHDYVLNSAGRIWFIRGRLQFSGKGSAPFPSALAVFGRPV